MPWVARCALTAQRLCEQVAAVISLDVGKPFYRPAVEDFTTHFPGSRPDIDEPFRAADHVEIMFDDEQGCPPP